jgi:hypothetical protein
MKVIARSAAAVVPLSLVLSFAAPATAQDVQYETVTKLSIPGAAGTVMRIAARLSGTSLETVEKTYISGNRMRTDVDRTSTLIDLDAGSVTMIDHEQRTFTTMSFDEMIAVMQQAVREGQAAAVAERDGRQEAGRDDADVQIDFRLSVDAPGERERLHGYNAERFFVTMEAESEAALEEGGPREQTGTFVVLSDIWASTEMPAYTAQRAFGDKSAQVHAVAASSFAEALTSALAEDPDMKVAFEQAATEASRIEGMAMRTTMLFVSVPPGMTFDRQLALEPAAGTGLAAAAGRAALGGLRQRAAASASSSGSSRRSRG